MAHHRKGRRYYDNWQRWSVKEALSAVLYRFMVLVIGISFAFACLRPTSGSIWPAALLHAVHNTLIQSVLDRLTVDTGLTAYFTTEFGLGLALTGAVVGVFFRRQGRALAAAPQAVGA